MNQSELKGSTCWETRGKKLDTKSWLIIIIIIVIVIVIVFVIVTITITITIIIIIIAIIVINIIIIIIIIITLFFFVFFIIIIITREIKTILISHFSWFKVKDSPCLDEPCKTSKSKNRKTREIAQQSIPRVLSSIWRKSWTSIGGSPTNSYPQVLTDKLIRNKINQ